MSHIDVNGHHELFLGTAFDGAPWYGQATDRTLPLRLPGAYDRPIMTSSDRSAIRRVDRIDRRIAKWMRKYGYVALRVAVAIVFIWFGALKYFPHLSPATDLVKKTVYWFPPEVFIPILATWEVLIGVCLLIRPLIRLALLLLFLQMGGTFLPLVLLPEATWLRFPYAPTLEGQYILKNLVIIGAALVIGSTVRQSSTEERKL
jgi:uncharacterized membrane protein YkgB